MHNHIGAVTTIRSVGKWLLMLWCLLLLSACQRQAVTKPEQVAELADLAQLNGYQFRGKMSFSDGQEGGSGQVQWQQQQGYITARLKAPIGGKSWQITETPDGAEISTSEGALIYGVSPTQLVSEQLGWQVPWTALTSWVIGQVHNSDQAQLNWQSDGYVIAEQGWQITYSKLKSYPAGLLPHKMIARKGDHSIKLVIRSWQW